MGHMAHSMEEHYDEKVIKMNKEMKKREEYLGNKWKDEGDGYFSLVGKSEAGMIAMAFIGSGSGEVAYIALPEGHPDIGKGYDDLNPKVNGGLTFSQGNVFGWDYAHAYNYGTPTKDIKNAINYFKKRK